MIENDRFDRALAAALVAYGQEAPTEVDAVAVARAIARRHPRRRALPVPLRVRPTLRGWLLVGALVAAAMAALVIVGSAERTRERIVVTPPEPVPPELQRRWQATFGLDDAGLAPGTYTVDFSVLGLVQGPDGETIERFGRPAGMAHDPAALPSWADRDARLLLVAGPAPCGDARYLIHGVGEVGERTVVTWLPKGPLDLVRFVPVVDACPERRSLLTTPAQWTTPDPGPIFAEQAYDLREFSEPFSFVAPHLPGWGGATGTVESWGGPGGLELAIGCCSALYVIDDQPLPVDICDPPAGAVDVPDTVEGVGAWLRRSAAVRVSDGVPLQVDGRTALRFDVELPETCRFHGPHALPAGFRYYAIPTGDDVLVVLVDTDPPVRARAGPAADGFVRSMDFH